MASVAKPTEVNSEVEVAEAKAEMEDVAKAKAEMDKYTKFLSGIVFLRFLALSVTWGARDDIALKELGDAGAAGQYLAKMDTIGALMEFFVNPILSKASDAWGRQPFLPLSFVTSAACCGYVASRGTLLSLFIEKLLGVPLLTNLITILRAALSDLLSRTKDTADFAMKQAHLSSFAGLGMIVGPLLGGYLRTMVTKRGGNGDRFAFLVSGLLALAPAPFLVGPFGVLAETLPAEQRITLTRSAIMQDMQPFSFLKAVRASSKLGRMFMSEGFQTIAEDRNLAPANALLITTDLGWNMNQFARLLAGAGFCVAAGGLIVKQQMELMGMRLFTTVSNVTNFFTSLLYGLAGVIEQATGIPSTRTVAFSVLASIPGARKRDGIEGVMMLLGESEGFGRGYMSGALMNFRAVFNVLSPMCWGYLYAWGKKRGRPYLPWVYAGLSNLAAEVVMQTLSNADLMLDDQGNPIGETAKETKTEEAGTDKKSA